MVVCSTGTTDERAAACMSELVRHPQRISTCDLLAIVGHSQGGVVGMKVLERLLDAGLVTGKRVGILTLAGVHGGTFEPLTNPIRPATSELALLAQAEAPGTIAYRQTVMRVLNAGVQVLAVHSFGDNLVNLTSSTFGFLGPSPSNLCLGLYLCKDQATKLSNSAERWVPRLYQIYLRARNLGFAWHPSFVAILEEADPFSTVAAQTYPMQMAFSWALLGYPAVQVSLNHSELVSCDALYVYAALWLTADTSNLLHTPLVTEVPQPLCHFSGVFDFVLSEVERAELFDSRLNPYAQTIRGEILQFKSDLRADLPDLKSRPSFSFFSRMDRLFHQKILPCKHLSLVSDCVHPI